MSITHTFESFVNGQKKWSFKYFAAFKGCYSLAGLPSGLLPSYSSPMSMTVAYCLQVCQGLDVDFQNATFMGIQVSQFHQRSTSSFCKCRPWKRKKDCQLNCLFDLLGSALANIRLSLFLFSDEKKPCDVKLFLKLLIKIVSSVQFLHHSYSFRTQSYLNWLLLGWKIRSILTLIPPFSTYSDFFYLFFSQIRNLVS